MDNWIKIDYKDLSTFPSPDEQVLVLYQKGPSKRSYVPVGQFITQAYFSWKTQSELITQSDGSAKWVHHKIEDINQIKWFDYSERLLQDVNGNGKNKVTHWKLIGELPK